MINYNKKRLKCKNMLCRFKRIMTRLNKNLHNYLISSKISLTIMKRNSKKKMKERNKSKNLLFKSSLVQLEN